MSNPTFSKFRRPLTRCIAAIAAVASLAAFAACGSPSNKASGNNDSATSSSQSSKNQGFPVSIKHVYGTTTIKAKPKRVATVGWGSFDNLIALGVVPVSIEKNTYGKTVHGGFLPWTYDALKKMGVKDADMPQLHDESDGIDAEAIAAAKPDLIIGLQSGMTRKDYDTLSKIAPTIAYQKVSWGDPWRGMIKTTAQALGEPAKGDKLISSLEAQLKSDAAKYPQIAGKTAAVMSFDASKLSSFSVYTTTDVRPQLLNDLGMKTPESVIKLSRGTDKFYKDVSAENADQFKDVDVIVTYGTADTLAAMQKDPLLSKIPAVKRGSVVVIDNNSDMANALDPTALSIPKMDGEYTKMLGEAAAKVK
ncbi:iron-siderophore ABC transporter substrate-binding protein [Bifidobacterium sp. ESL0769]|uniref:iron-siderophore ABC transporter substrate-binding protein n=1 Tax=Bifidobacterium sp. ESL0769 TaxID=2983229 RepID=UPI0023F88C6F|nr:iron-siderophore ABC transporter substrate-binding protein [Bifidobacterium sp. ESL0769]WEV67318.1 iron-siderophore ABC transporter substrate-binding protein [Bifidobacterium sp. ESL0769]